MVEMERGIGRPFSEPETRASVHFGIRFANVANNLHRNEHILTPFSLNVNNRILHLLLLNIGARHRSDRRDHPNNPSPGGPPLNLFETPLFASWKFCSRKIFRKKKKKPKRKRPLPNLNRPS